MKTKLVAYFDRKLGVFTQPISMPDVATEDLIEQTRRMCANPKVPEAYFDYELYELGSYDDKRGQIVINEKPEFIVSLSDFRSLRSEGSSNA